jgi:hypothetical protein
METESNANTLEEAVPSTAGRPPPVILTANTNFIELQSQREAGAPEEEITESTQTNNRKGVLKPR